MTRIERLREEEQELLAQAEVIRCKGLDIDIAHENGLDDIDERLEEIDNELAELYVKESESIFVWFTKYFKNHDIDCVVDNNKRTIVLSADTVALLKESHIDNLTCIDTDFTDALESLYEHKGITISEITKMEYL